MLDKMIEITWGALFIILPTTGIVWCLTKLVKMICVR